MTFARSGVSVTCPDSKPSVLELADACDVPTRWSCRTGVCHTCTTLLLSGDIAYSPTPLEPPTATCSSAVPSPAPTSSSTCKAYQHHDHTNTAAR